VLTGEVTQSNLIVFAQPNRVLNRRTLAMWLFLLLIFTIPK
jgi:hypothetical protein